MEERQWIPRMLLILFNFSLCFSWVSPAPNVHTGIYTIVLGINDFPEVMSLATVNGEAISYLDSKIHRCFPRQQFMADSFDAQFWDYISDLVVTHTNMANKTLNAVMKRINQTSGIHTFQRITTVEVSDDGSIKTSMRFGFDGKDFISLDPNRMKWIASNPIAVMTKEKWDSDNSWNNYWKVHLEEGYVESLKRYLKAGKEYFTRKVQPEVFISRTEPNGQDKPLTLSCLVTGFYPVDIEVTWLRNGEVMSETQSSGVRPNHDGTHQIQKKIEISAGDEDQYSCQIEHSSLAEAQLYQWEIPKNSMEHFHLVIVIGLIAAITTIFGIIICKKPWRDSPNGTYMIAHISEVSVPAPS
ncbi:class I histocompatibility antigen, F10 alpha chain-like isoform X2 [Chiloscyllium punctatum]|uniref:class I histocompatibility antigen, F10 alpha chain-like isoform X2 n=1 Tax=Chiloscyllium punctatum TaxID=137246 RepID=UPI003B63B163